LVVLDGLVAGIRVIDVGLDVAAGRLPDLQQVGDDRVPVPRRVDAEVGLGETEPLERRRWVVGEEPRPSAYKSSSSRNCGAVETCVGGMPGSEFQPTSSRSSNGIK
jgi:hypothetical protein